MTVCVKDLDFAVITSGAHAHAFHYGKIEKFFNGVYLHYQSIALT